MRTPRLLALALALSLPAAAAAQPGALVPGFTATKTPVSPAGVRATIDLPAALHIRNTGGSDGAGLCVPTSVTVAARWHGLREMDGFRAFTERRPGGSYPEKLARDLAAYGRARGVAVPRYVQATGGDLAFLELCFATRRMPAMTHTRVHMVNGMHLDARGGAILDNNDPGRWEWADRATFLRAWDGWAFVWLAPPPPPGADAAPPAPPAPDEAAPVRPCPGPNCPRAPRWHRTVYADGSELLKLHDGGVFLGAYDPARGTWHPAAAGGGWLADPDGEPPAPVPGGVGSLARGVDAGMIAARPRYWVDGLEVSRARAVAAVVEGTGLEDDSDRHHLTVAGAADAPAAVRAALAALPGAARVHLQVYDRTDWPVQTGRVKPGITLQEPAKTGGRVVYQASAYAPALLAEAVERTDPDYRPAPVPAPAPRPKADPAPAPAPVRPEPPAIPPAAPAAAPAKADSAPAAPPDPPGGLMAVLAGVLYLFFPSLRR